MKKFVFKALVTLDLWLALVSATVFTTLYMLNHVSYLNELIIVLTSVVAFNLIVIFITGIFNIREVKGIQNKDSKNY